MGHSLVSGKPYSLILDLRTSGEQNKNTCSKYGLMHCIGGPHIRSLGRWGLVRN